MRIDNPRIDKDALWQLIHDSFEIDIRSFEFFPVGEDSYGYVCQSGTGTKYFVKVYDELRRPNLAEQHGIVHRLQNRCGLSFVLPPISTSSGNFLVEFGGFAVSIFPFIEGHTHHQTPFSLEEQDRVARMLAELHEAETCPYLPLVHREQFQPPFKKWISPLFIEAGQETPPRNDHHRMARWLIQKDAFNLLRMIENTEALGSRVRRRRAEVALTHGDATSANIILDPRGKLHMIDWSDILVAPPERDLAYVACDDTARFLRVYLETRTEPVTLNLQSFEYYIYYWILFEIADYGTRLLLEEMPEVERTHAWKELNDYLPLREAEMLGDIEKFKNALDQL